MIGLQTALTLLEEGGDAYRIYVVAEFLPGDEHPGYASVWYVWLHTLSEEFMLGFFCGS